MNMNELPLLPAPPTEKKSLVAHCFGGFFWGVFAVAILSWCVDAWLVAFFDEQQGFLAALIKPGEDDLVHRLITSVAFLALGMTANGFVSRLKEAKLGLQESQAWLNIMSDASFEGLFISENGKILAVNERGCRDLGYSREELIGRSIFDLADLESRQVVKEHLAGRLEDTYVVTGVRKDGEKIDVEIRARTVDINGRNLRVSALLDVTHRHKAEQNLRGYERQLRSMTTRLALAEEKVRRDIAIALHDSVAQQLSIAKLKLGSVLKDTSDEGSFDSLHEINELIDDAIRETRTLVFDLSPPVLYELGFVAAVEWLSDMLSERHGIECGVKVVGGELLLDHDLRVTMYQLVRELLVNVTKHSGAKSATVSISENSGMLCVDVKDNGCGFNMSAVGPGFGLFSIRERLKPLDGKLNIDSEPGKGSTVGICIPLGERGESNAS